MDRPVRTAFKEITGRDLGNGTLCRWLLHDICGVKLDAIKISGAWHCTPQAMETFLRDSSAARIAKRQGSVIQTPEQTRSATRTAKAIAKAQKTLADVGI
jgi:hypothetical protein